MIACVPLHAQARARADRARDRRTYRTRDSLADLARTVAAAEASLRERELQQAESLYRSALFDAWMMLGHLHVAAAKMD